MFEAKVTQHLFLTQDFLAIGSPEWHVQTVASESFLNLVGRGENEPIVIISSLNHL